MKKGNVNVELEIQAVIAEMSGYGDYEDEEEQCG